MADLSDIENALVQRLIDIIYPDGLDRPSIAGSACRIYRGWPSPASLNNDLNAGLSNITVVPGSSPTEILPHYFDDKYAAPTAPGLHATVANQIVTIFGTAGPSETVGLLIDDTPVLYRTTAGDTASLVAANLAAQTGTFRIATYVGATLEIPGAARLIARVATRASVARALRRQRSAMQISCWCPSPALRDTLGAAVDSGIALKRFVALPDGSSSHIVFHSNHLFDQSQNASLYRRDILYCCEYSVLTTESVPVMIFGDLLTGGARFTI